MGLIWFAHLPFQRKNKQTYNLINVNLTAYAIYYGFLWHTKQKLRFNWDIGCLLTHSYNVQRNECFIFFSEKARFSYPLPQKQTNKPLKLSSLWVISNLYVEDFFAHMSQISIFGQALESKTYIFNH